MDRHPLGHRPAPALSPSGPLLALRRFGNRHLRHGIYRSLHGRPLRRRLLRTRRRPCGPHRAGAAPHVRRGGWPARRPQPQGARPRLHAGDHLPRALQRAEVLRRARRPKARLEAPLVQRRRRGRLCAGGGPVRLHHDRRLPHLRLGLVRLHPEQLRHRRRTSLVHSLSLSLSLSLPLSLCVSVSLSLSLSLPLSPSPCARVVRAWRREETPRGGADG
mmetsp:Transcript_17555/g.57537  ORF Transcript_17555/g.57537 Transcript_17555/m.57537 type:complete len:218 (+) Transcript_17555:610-1263(+)